MKALKILTLSLLVASSAFAAGITGSKHDLVGSAGTIKVTSAATVNSELCVFCHTPHGSNSSFVGAPIWNKNDTDTTPTYTLYGTTIAGTVAGAVSNSSKACLSCHDGVSAINSLVNAPGSGLAGDNSTNLPGMAGGADEAQFVMPATEVTSIGRYGTNGDAANVVNLTNDHPVSIEYTGTGAVDSPASLADIDGIILNSATVVWTTGQTTENIRDLLRGAGSDQVECSSCHDPHLGDADTFLRTGDNAGSKLCLGCHNK